MPANSAVGPSASEPDPVLLLRRDHTLLEMLAEGFRQVGRTLASAGEVPFARLREAAEIHRLFLIETHHRREEVLERALAPLAGQPFRAELDRCRAEHLQGHRASERLRGLLERWEHADRAARRELGDALVQEAHRWMEHHRWEEEHFYAAVHDRISPELAAQIGTDMRSIRRAMGGVEERLISWTSALGPSSD